MAILRAALGSVVLIAIVGVGARLLTAPAYGAPASASRLSAETPPFVEVGKRYAFTWAGGGPAQTYTVKALRQDGWILVNVAEENVNPAYLVPGELPIRWLNVALAISIQEMRPFVQ